MVHHELILFRTLKSLVTLIGDDDLPDNGELSGAAVCDLARSIVTAYEAGDEETLWNFEQNEQTPA